MKHPPASETYLPLCHCSSNSTQRPTGFSPGPKRKATVENQNLIPGARTGRPKDLGPTKRWYSTEIFTSLSTSGQRDGNDQRGTCCVWCKKFTRSDYGLNVIFTVLRCNHKRIMSNRRLESEDWMGFKDTSIFASICRCLGSAFQTQHLTV